MAIRRADVSSKRHPRLHDLILRPMCRKAYIVATASHHVARWWYSRGEQQAERSTPNRAEVAFVAPRIEQIKKRRSTAVPCKRRRVQDRENLFASFLQLCSNVASFRLREISKSRSNSLLMLRSESNAENRKRMAFSKGRQLSQIE